MTTIARWEGQPRVSPQPMWGTLDETQGVSGPDLDVDPDAAGPDALLHGDPSRSTVLRVTRSGLAGG